jgi:hypothetical protein
MRRWRSPSIAFAKAPRGRISSGIEDQNASVAVRDSNYRTTKLVRRPLGVKPAAKGDT